MTSFLGRARDAMQIGELAVRACELRETLGRRVIIGMAGPPGAGKSTFAENLNRELGTSSALLPMDGFHLSNEVLCSLGREDRKGAPDTFDISGYLTTLRRLKYQNETVFAPRFDRARDEAIGAAISIGPDVSIVITEGNYLLLDQPGWRDVHPLLDEAWWIHSDSSTRVRRLVARHQQFGRSLHDAERWVHRSDEANAELVQNDQEKAQLIIANYGGSPAAKQQHLYIPSRTTRIAAITQASEPQTRRGRTQ